MDILDFIVNAFNGTIDYFNNGFSQWLVNAISYLYIQLFHLWISAKIFFVGLSLNVMQSVLQSIDISGPINSALSDLHPYARYLISELRVLEGLNIIVSAFITRLGLKASGL